ncbi:MAG: 4Fe-4S dicluster domain-containing protein, partial [Bryobacteraceae bacterium]
YVVESQFSVTGGMADHRLRLRASEVPGFAVELGRQLGVLPPVLTVLNGADTSRKWLAAVARDLKRNRGQCVVVAGPRQPAIVHALAHAINQALGNAGKTVTYLDERDAPQLPALKRLAAEMHAGQVDTLVMFGGNPAYDAPADLDFSRALSKVPVTVYAGIEPNETAALAKWSLPEAHYLEAWSDARALDGTVSIQQPLIRPLFGGRTHAEVLALISGSKDQRGYEIVRNFWLTQWPADSAESIWRKALHDGVVPDTAFRSIEPAIDAKRIAAEAAKLTNLRSDALEIAFYPSASAYDGRFANNGWLQEAPDPITRLTWDNVAILSPATARRLGLNSEEVVAIESAGRSLEAPVWIQPGHVDNAISIALGYGRTHCGRVGKNVGRNAYLLRTSAALYAASCTLRKTGRTYPLAATQHHNSMEGRPLVREASLEEYGRHPDFAAKAGPEVQRVSIFGEHSYSEGNQWGMAIDLNSCVGCNACVLACQAENNIAIVGKDQVRRGREMHWIRMDRYYAGSEDEPESVTQPVACQQCENAPCETVCPVAATSHSPEGLNDMAYNRCVGTRYCANNCPYKVRRFNFLNYHKEWPEIEKMAFNPDVTVRMRGVMEKCTYCVQRIQEKKIQAQAEGHRPVRDGEIVTACQQTCPAEAIVFGNINDPKSRVSQLRRQNRDYALLGELNTRPRTTYLAKLRNPNPELS